MYSDQGYSSVFVNWTKQVCLQTRLKWWQWWGTPDNIWNCSRQKNKQRKMNDHQVLPYCVQVYWEEAWCMSWSECCGCAMAFYAACQWHMMVQYCCGSTNKLFCNECKFRFFLFTPRLERWRRGRWYPMFKCLRRSTVERLSKDVFVLKERSSVRV